MNKVHTETKRETGSGTDLWRVATAPAIWAAHFLVCYVAAAIYCEKIGRDAVLDPARWIVIGATVVAIGGIGLVFWSLWKVRGLSVRNDNLNFSANTAEERHRFLSHVALMLCVLSLVSVILVAVPSLMLETCR